MFKKPFVQLMLVMLCWKTQKVHHSLYFSKYSDLG